MKNNYLGSFAVIGCPVEHSLSPQVHQAFAQQWGATVDYTRRLASATDFLTVLADCHQRGLRGLNITLPFKQQAYAAAVSCTARAQIAGAVNTLTRLSTGWAGDNTDGVGLVRDIQHNLQIPLHGSRVLILGAGGAVRGLLDPVLAALPQQVKVVGRAIEKVESLCHAFAARVNKPGQLVASDFAALAESDDEVDLIINALPVNVAADAVPDLPRALFEKARAAYDLSYGVAPTWFQRVATDNGCCLVFDGLGMLVEQAAESFKIWHGQSIVLDTQAVIRTLRKD